MYDLTSSCSLLVKSMVPFVGTRAQLDTCSCRQLACAGRLFKFGQKRYQPYPTPPPSPPDGTPAVATGSFLARCRAHSDGAGRLARAGADVSQPQPAHWCVLASASASSASIMSATVPVFTELSSRNLGVHTYFMHMDYVWCCIGVWA